MKRYSILWIFLLSVLFCSAQKAMSPPTVMIVPDDIYCKQHGYTINFNNQGIVETKPDYERALTEDAALHPVLTQIAELITDRNDRIVIIDLMTAIDNYKADRALDAANGTEESADEAIVRRSEADIIVKVHFDLIKNGPQRQVQYTITGTDAYTANKFAPITGVGEPSTNAAPAILVREAIFGKMDAFLEKVLAYYTNMVKNGRQVAINFKVTNGAGLTMDSKVGNNLLKEVIDDCLYDLSVDGNGLERVRGGSNFLNYSSIYIPLFANVRGRERKQKTEDVARKVSTMLESHNIKSHYTTVGLGKVNFYIGE